MSSTVCLTLEELVWVVEILRQYQNEHSLDYTARNIITKIENLVGDIRCAPVTYELGADR